MTKYKVVLEGELQDEMVHYTSLEIIEIFQIDETILQELIEHGIVEPQVKSMQLQQFSSDEFIRIRKAIRLHRDLSVNWPGIALALELLDEIEQLRNRLR